MKNVADLGSAKRNEDAGWFRSRVLTWFSMRGREFSWRRTQDPYAVLLAELMLHRTQARQVEPVYRRFLEAYPTLRELAKATEADVKQALAPLGLDWRLARIIPMARLLIDQYHGEVPRNRDALLALPGVGPYIADAVRVLAYDDVAALVDTNTVRVAGRYFGFATHAESRRRQPVREAIALLVDTDHPRDSNLALLDLAALVCRSIHPLCGECPVARRCAYRKHSALQRSDSTQQCGGHA